MPLGVGFLLVLIGPGKVGGLNSFCPGVLPGGWSGLELIDT